MVSEMMMTAERGDFRQSNTNIPLIRGRHGQHRSMGVKTGHCLHVQGRTKGEGKSTSICLNIMCEMHNKSLEAYLYSSSLTHTTACVGPLARCRSTCDGIEGAEGLDVSHMTPLLVVCIKWCA